MPRIPYSSLKNPVFGRISAVSYTHLDVYKRQLEASIELRLFERVRQRMQRTPEATLLYEEIRRLNVGLESLGRKIRAIRGAAQPRLRIGCIHAYSLSLIHI